MNVLGSRALWLRVGIILVLGVILTVFSFRVARILEDQRIARDLQISAADRVAAVQSRINDQLGLLQAVAAYWTVTGGTDYAGFRDFVTPLFPRGAELTAIGWVPLVTAQDRAAVESSALEDGLAGYHFTERGPGGELQPVTAREFYTPVLYIEPLEGNEPAVGFDLWSEDNRRAVLQAARDSGQPHTTQRLHLVQERRPRSGLLTALPVYRQGAELATAEDRRHALSGFVTAVYWIDETVQAGLSTLQPAGIDLYFLDSTEDAAGAGPVYVHGSRIRGNEVPLTWSPSLMDTTPSHLGRLDVGGREWHVLSLPASGFVAARRGPLPWFLVAVGVLATIVGVTAFATSERRTNKLRQAHADLADSEIRLRNVVQNMPVLMSALDADGQIISWNRECERVVGFSADELPDNPGLLEQIYPEAAHREASDGKRVWDDYLNRERTLIAKDGAERTISWSNLSNAIPIPGWASWHIGIDVTARNRADRERLEMREQFLQSQKLESLGLLAGGIAHDFNNLLTAILGNASLAQDAVSPTSSASTALDGVVKASQRAALLTQQLLAYTGRGTTQPEALDLSELVREIGSLLSATISKKVKLNVDLAPDLPAVQADTAQMQQLVMNLVINGAEAAGDQPGTVSVRTGTRHFDAAEAKCLRAEGDLKPGLYVFVEVRDDGHGMDPGTKERIFDPFFSTKFTGRGLGLAAAVGIVRSHGGGMAVTSEVGQGSVFEVFLPASGEKAARKPEAKKEALDGEGLILVVDDEPSIREIATRSLTGLGYRVLTAVDGIDAIEVFKQHGERIDCVILDLTMPNLDGNQTLRALRELRQDVVAILSSGYDETAATARLAADEPAGFLHKPYKPSDLAAKIRSVLGAGQRGNCRAFVAVGD